jgi:hypothetical protein
MRGSAALFSGITWASLMANIAAQEAAKPNPPIATAQAERLEHYREQVKLVVESYFSNWKSGKGAESVPLFHAPEVVVTGTLHVPNRPQYWHKTAKEHVQQFPDKPIEYLPVEAIDVDVVHEGLAIARVKYRGGGHKDTAVFALAPTEKGDWKIVSLFVDSHFVW